MKRNIHVLCILLLSLIHLKCTKDKTTVYPYYGPVTVTQAFAASNTLPDFSAGDKVYFTAGFAQNVNWTIHLVGKTTGAVKTITGISSQIDASNSLWNGSSDNANAFKNETAVATLSFNGDTTTYSVNIVISGMRNADAGAVLITDFKTYVAPISAPPLPGKPTPAGWIADWQNKTTGDTKFSFADGNNYMYMSGHPWKDQNGALQTPINPYINFLQIPVPYTQATNLQKVTTLPITPQNTRVYFNLLVCNTGTKYTRLLVTINEASGNSYSFNVYPNWPVGTWKLLSYNYSELTNGTGNSGQINMIQFTLLSSGPQDVLDLIVTDNANAKAGKYDVSAAFDHPVFTLDAPWQP